MAHKNYEVNTSTAGTLCIVPHPMLGNRETLKNKIGSSVKTLRSICGPNASWFRPPGVWREMGFASQLLLASAPESKLAEPWRSQLKPEAWGSSYTFNVFVLPTVLHFCRLLIRVPPHLTHRITGWLMSRKYMDNPPHTYTACWRPFIALISQYHQHASLVLGSPGTKVLHSQPEPPPPSLRNFPLAELAAAINDLICDLSLCSWDCKCSYSIWGKGLGCSRPPKQAATQGCNFTLSLSH